MEHTFNKIIDLLFLARQKGVEVMLTNERLQLKAGEDVEIDEQLLNEIRANKQSIIDYLSSDDWKAVAVNGNYKKISPFNRATVTHIPASFSQERLWFIDHLSGSIEYHSPTILRLTGNLDKAALAFSLKAVIERHEVLRTVFYEIDGQVYQSIKESAGWQLEIRDGVSYPKAEATLQLYIGELVKKPFDLAKDFPVRSTLINLHEQEHILVVTVHHIASDAWSTGIIVNEIVELYSGYTQGRDARLALLPLQYADFSVWQRNYLRGEVLNKKITYWKNKLEGLQTLQLPADYPRSSAQSSFGASSPFSIDKKLSAKLHDLSQKEGASLYMVLLAAFKILLSRYSGQQDITVGTSIASRQQKELEGLIGYFVNTLALRDEIAPDIPFTKLLQQVKTTTLGAYEHQDIPFEKVVEVAVKDRDPERSPLFQVMLVLINTPEASKLVLGDVELRRDSFETNISKFELTFFITESPNGLSGHVDYRKDLFAAATINRMLSHYITLLSSIVANPQQKAGLLPMLKAEEEQQLLQAFNDSEVACPQDKTIVDLFEEQAAKRPDDIAVVFEKELLTYGQLNERSNQLAHYLISGGIKPDSLVPLFMERSALMMVGMLGIMKAGAAYVPIDTDFPADRISYMLEDAGAKVIVSNSAVSGKLEVKLGVQIVETDQLSSQPAENPMVALLPHHLLYVIYTSGSTGRPKGVMIEHRHLVDYYFGLKKNIQIDECRSFALVSTIATDLGNTVIYGSLLSGGALHIFSKESVSNIEYLHRYFSENQIDCLKIVPSHWKALRNGHSLLLPKKLLVFGGEALQWEVAEQIQAAGTACRIVNHYGPTETTVGKLLHPVQPGKIYNQTIPVGRPFSNTKVYVLSKEMQLCPAGVPGQLYISGDGVARGYYNNEALTNEKFTADPFSRGENSGLKMYGTGDLVKWSADGNITFIGRVDDQVKIRGYRVEPGEIERVLQQTSLVSEAVVLARPDKQDNIELVAYVVPQDAFNREGIVAYLKDKLPDYMVPAKLVELESLPLTANGKVDRKALPDPNETETGTDQYVAPRNDTEAKMATLWADVLEVEKIGVHHDFFELGGHSLLAVRLVSAIRKAFEVEMPIGHIFDYPTVAALSAQLSGQKDTAMLPVIEVANPKPEHIPLSFSQERLWFIHQMGGSRQYHVPAILRLTGKLNRAALAAALQNVVNRHEVLRTVIHEQEGRPYQQILDMDSWNLSVVDGSVYAQDTEGLQRYIQELIAAPFDLPKDHKIRGHLIFLNEEEHILVITLHHIASDGWSRSILVKEVVESYSAFEEARPVNLPALPVQYADFSIWQRNYVQGDILEKKLGYWKEKLRDLTPLQLPTDYSRPKLQTAKGASTGFGINALLLKQLHELSTRQGVTLFMTLLAAFKVLLHRYSGQQDICVGAPIAGRQQQELEGLIGFFVNTLALRSEVNGNVLFTDLLQQIKATTLEAYEHQEIPFEKVVDSVVTERDLSRNPLFQVMLILRNTPDVPELNLGEVSLRREIHQYSTTLFDLTLFVTETGHGLQCAVEYSTDLYGEATVNRLSAHFKELLNSIVAKPEQEIALLPMVSAAEKQQLLVEFNDTQIAYPDHKSIVALFEDQVAKTPEAIAVVFEQEQLSFDELNQRANQLAHYLVSKGVGEEMLVPICVERSLHMIVGILGVLKTGAAFVPVDPEYPIERIKYLIANTGAEIIVSNKENKTKLQSTDGLDIIEIDNDWSLISCQPTTNLPIAVSPHHLIYVIHTSGSTGTPKGVQVEHGSVVNLLKSIEGTVGFTANSGLLSVTTFSFDIFYLECFMPLINGGKLFIVSREVATDGFRLKKSITLHQPTHLQATPATWQLLLDAGWKNKEGIQILIGGEAVKEELKDELTKLGDVYNLYGPTETTIWSVTKKLETGEKVLIGKPIANTSIYIIGEAMQLVPVGVAGEICIGGAGLARGYLNRPDLTAQKFISNPFSDKPESRIYRTGDMGRWLPDGNLEYMGRIDDQVKIRGYRIELGEIETVLTESELVKTAVVLAKEDNENNKRLIGYYVPEWAAIKDKEQELYEKQVESWKEIYETEYAHGAESEDEEFDINIWKDSFTGKPIDAGQMQEWLQDIVNVILSQKAGNVLEIGSGTGLIYYQLAGKVKKYIGTDFSKSSINQITKRIQKGLRDYGPTELMVCAAHQVSLPADEQVDTIIMNSIIQYFPGEQYMDEVITNCISLLHGSGRIIIGDVRDNRLLKLFKGRLQMQHMGPSVNIKEFNWAVEQEVLKEEELLFSPDYFYRLPSIHPQIAHVEIKWKEGDNINELTLYRYTVVLHVDNSAELIEPVWQDWNKLGNKTLLTKQIEENTDLIALQNVPNFRLWQEQLLSKALHEKAATTIGDLINSADKEDKENLEVKDIIEIAKTKGYNIQLLLNEDPLKINLLFESRFSGRPVRQPDFTTKKEAGISYTNIPLFSDISLLLQKDLKALIKQRLPEYMVPSELVALNELPLTSNGKIDRRFLNLREEKFVSNKLNYQPPQTAIEITLAAIWQELLGIERIGTHDNFFELGGHSLLAMRAVSAVRKQLNIEVLIKDLFAFATIGELAAHLGAQGRGLLLPAIEAQPRPGRIPLSFSQERLWFIDRLQGSTQYHIPAVLRLQGKLDTEALSNALQQIVHRHEVLRTVIREEEGAGYQHIQTADDWQLQMADGSKYKDNPISLQQYIKNYIEAPFDLSADYMLRAVLISLSDEDHLLAATLHHIASDGWSTSILINELTELYNAYVDQRTATLLPLPVQYADYALWQRKYLQGEAWDKKLSYWKDKLEETAPLQLPTDYSRPPVQSTNGAITGLRIDKALSDQLQTLSQQQGTTLFMTLLATFNVLLYRYSGQQDICIGTPIAGRQQQELEGLIGFFVNTLALRSEIDGSATFTELLQQVKVTTLEAYEHQEVPFEKVVDMVVKQRDMSRSPLFQVMLVLQNTPEVAQLQLGNLVLSSGVAGVSTHVTSKFDLIFNVAETAQGLTLTAEYSTDLYKEQTVNRMMAHFVELLRSVVQVPQQSIGKLLMLGKDEQQELLIAFNDTASDYPDSKSIIAVFEEQVIKFPESIALQFENETLTYQQLNELSNGLAHYLVTVGVKSGTMVPLFIERSKELIIGILGILKSGGIYVPIDPGYPAERINYMFADIGANRVLTSTGSRQQLPDNTEIEIIELDKNLSILDGQPVSNLHTAVTPESGANIIYTSGSAGRPKGVIVTQKNVVSLVKEVDYVTLTSNDVLLSTGSPSFDATTFEYWSMLLNGGTLVVCKETTLLDSQLLKAEISTRKVNLMWFTSSWFNQLVEADITLFENLKTILVGGEKLSEQHIGKLRQTYPDIQLLNGYGPTENTTFSSTYLIKEKEIHTSIPIGRPLNNRSVLILNENGGLVPTGVTGEICVSGTGLTKGYLNQPALTAEKFIDHPFSKLPGEKIYKTGDLGSWLPDGNILYIGRKDEQVKIRGYRIEPGEIESILQESDMVANAVVVAKSNSEGTKNLVGYIIPADLYDRPSLISWLQARLPDYMVPVMWVELDQFPLTRNGKIDRDALPAPDGAALATHQYVAPRNELEKTLAEIWETLLPVQKAGIEDNFFDIGGHSLLAMRVISAIRKQLQVELKIKELFVYPTIALLAGYIQGANKGLLLPAIEAQPRPERIPLSFSQERLYFIDRLQGSTQYHIPAVLRLKGKLNVPALSYALQQIVYRHEVLRTVILEEEGTGYQHINSIDGWQLQIAEGSTYHDDPKELQQYLKHYIEAPFNLSEDYMLRAMLIRVAEEEHLLAATLHHIAADGWSTSILINELAEQYNAYVDERTVSLLPLPVQYADYALWQRKYLQGEAWERKLGYWKDKLEETAPLQLPTDYSRPPVQSTNGAITGLRIDKALSDQLQTLSQQQGTTLFMTLLATFNVLLYRYSGQQDICIGTPIAGRQQQELEGLIGFFVNTLALRSEIDGSATFTELLQQIKATTLEAYDYQEVPFERVVDMVVKQRDMSRSPLFQVMLVLQNTPEVAQLQLGDLALSRGTTGLSTHTTAKFDLIFNVAENEQGLLLTVEYSTDLYREETVSRMMAHFAELLRSVVEGPQQSIGKLPMLNSVEQLLLKGFNDTSVAYPADKTIVDLFEEQVARTPDAIAVVFEEGQLTYAALNSKANQLASYLHNRGIATGVLVPLCIERSLDMVISVLAILKAGAAYVPIDPEYPQERIRLIIEDTGATLLISNTENINKLPAINNVAVVNLTEDRQLINKEPAADLSFSRNADNLAYVLYTSGSTGKPKGVRMPGKALVNLLSWQQKQFSSKDRRVLQFASLNFDVSFQEIFSTLCFGSTLYLIDEERRKDMAELVNDIHQHQLTHLFLPYIVLKTLAEYAATLPYPLFSLQELMIAGEQLKLTDDIRQLLSTTKARLVNQYGPTEAHVVSSYIIEAGSDVPDLPPIGKPIDNTALYILSAEQQLVPVGVAGELYIGGVQVARGYVNLPELTAERFIADPFSKEAEARMYRTGDLACWLPDGNIEYLGRADEQVKVRGYRIELGEIESILQQSDLVSQAVVLVKEDSNGNKNLVAYIVPVGVFDREALMSYLKSKLPDYMVPGLWVSMEQLPVNRNGKIDKQALPHPDSSTFSADQYEAPRNELETRLAEIWQELLGTERIGIHDNFFDLGGHSLLAMRLVSSIRKKLQSEVAIKTLFQNPTIAALGAHLQNHKEDLLLPPIEAQQRPEHIPLSFSQERLWFIDRLQGSVPYHMPAVLQLKGRLNAAALSHALQQVINRHEVLRTVIREQEGAGYQYIQATSGWQLQIPDGLKHKKDSDELQQYIKNYIAAPFDLSADYMLRAALISLAEEDHILALTVHHIAADGWSISVIVRELVAYYNSYVEGNEAILPELPVQYADYALWQRKYLQGEAWEKKLGYWKEKLEGTAPLQIPTDFNRSPVQSTNGAITGLRTDKALLEGLYELSRWQDTTLFMTLLATFNVLLHRYSGQQDVCVGTPIVGRQQQELEGLIGFFVNTLALRSEIDGSATFTELLQQVKVTTLEAYEHQEVPFEKVVDMVVKQRDMSRSPLFQVMLVLQNTPEVAQLQLGDLQLSSGVAGVSTHVTSKFDLIFNVAETAQGLTLTVEYSTDLYREETVRRMMAHFTALLHSVLETPGQSIGKLPMLGKDEQQKMLIAFNDTKQDYPTDKSITDLFEAQVARTPEATALVFEKQQLSYQELNKKANQLANYLRKKGVKEETLVPLCIERSLEMIVTVLAILKAGAAYVPIDPEYPQERISYMLEDMDATLLISSNENVSRFASSKKYEVINPGNDNLLISKEPSGNLQPAKNSDGLAYVLYTSGSTGRPKGVRMPGKALVNLLSWQQKQFSSKDRRVLQFASLNFDVSFQEIFSTLCFGSTLYLIDEERRKDMAELVNDIHQHQLTHLFLPYIVLKTLAEYAATLPYPLFSLQELMIAGEQLKLTDDIRQLLSTTKARLVNQYGPTEAHVVSSYIIEAGSDVPDLPPIGKPIDNTALYILSAEQQLVPVGVAGELYIGGVQVARGYVNLPELTAERFIADPFSKEAEARMYRTGDLACWLPDGNIEYLGRADEQVKVRGYRIELGEIESILQQSDLVSQAVVLVKEDKQADKQLVAYIVPNGSFNKEEIINYLKGKLPAYMVPSLLMEIESLPLTANGKVDKKALPHPEISQLTIKQYESPRDELETTLTAIWQELLHVERVGIHDNFFDLGGHSLYAIRLVWLIRKKMNLSVSVNEAFIHPTVASLAANIVNKVRNPSLPDVNIKYLVPIRTTGSKPPLYLVAGGGGTSLKIKKFAGLLDAEQPVYVFQPPIGGEDLKGFPDTIEGIAGVFIEEMLVQNPEGPYALSGHCIGGVIAFEMAKQLQARGKKVHSLALFDTIIRKQVVMEPGNLKNLFHIPLVIQKSLSRLMLKVSFQTYLLRKHPRQSVLYKVNTFRSIRNRIKRKNFKTDYLKYAGAEIFDQSIEIYIAAYRNYILQPYDGQIILFYATDRYFFLDRDNNIGYKKMQLDEGTKNSWKEYAAGITVYEIKGEHSDIFSLIHGEEFAQTLQRHLDQP